MKRAVALIATVVLAAGCVSSSVEPLDPAPEVPIPPTSSFVPDYSAVSLEPVAGETPTSEVGITGGNARIAGRVEGAAAGARVRIERLVGDQSAIVERTTNGEGFYSAEGLLGGRYRVRAFRPPDATSATAQVFFLRAGEQRSLNLRLESFGGGGRTIRTSLSPAPVVGSESLLVITVLSRGVDSAGVARSVPVAGVGVQLRLQSGRELLSSPDTPTDGSGVARFRLGCVSEQAQGITAVLDDGASFNVNVAACQPEPPEVDESPPEDDESDPEDD